MLPRHCATQRSAAPAASAWRSSACSSASRTTADFDTLRRSLALRSASFNSSGNLRVRC